MVIFGSSFTRAAFFPFLLPLPLCFLPLLELGGIRLSIGFPPQKRSGRVQALAVSPNLAEAKAFGIA
jgi:hypothetical protein